VTSESSQLGLWKVVWFRARAFLLVTIGWVLFRAPGLGQALHIFHSMFWPSGFGLTQDMSLVLSHQRQLILWFACLVVVLPRGFSMGKFLDEGRGRFAEGFRLAFVLAMIPITTILVAAGTFSPFLYYQF
jgi:alginate O-acetyltransferase complex protein AlgI